MSERDRVEAILERQIQIIGASGVSLDSLWRAAGGPDGHQPDRWLRLAAPAIAGFMRYSDDLARGGRTDGPGARIRRWDGGDAEPWHNGDLIASEPIARLYSSYLRSKC